MGALVTCAVALANPGAKGWGPRGAGCAPRAELPESWALPAGPAGPEASAGSPQGRGPHTGPVSQRSPLATRTCCSAPGWGVGCVGTLSRGSEELGGDGARAGVAGRGTVLSADHKGGACPSPAATPGWPAATGSTLGSGRGRAARWQGPRPVPRSLTPLPRGRCSLRGALVLGAPWPWGGWACLDAPSEHLGRRAGGRGHRAGPAAPHLPPREPCFLPVHSPLLPRGAWQLPGFGWVHPGLLAQG